MTEGTGQIDNNNLGYEGKASYSFAANDVTGKIWVSGKTQKIQTSVTAPVVAYVFAADHGVLTERTANAWDIGGKVGYAGAELVGYYYDGKNSDSGIGTALNTLTTTSGAFVEHDNSGGYVQATYVLPTKTKVGVSWGKNLIEKTGAELRDAEREAWVVGAYHPLTKHLNLVAEYNHLDTTAATGAAGSASEGKAKTVSLGAILFF